MARRPRPKVPKHLCQDCGHRKSAHGVYRCRVSVGNRMPCACGRGTVAMADPGQILWPTPEEEKYRAYIQGWWKRHPLLYPHGGKARRGNPDQECWRGGEVCPHCRIAESRGVAVTDVRGVAHGTVQPLQEMRRALRVGNPLAGKWTDHGDYYCKRCGTIVGRDPRGRAATADAARDHEARCKAAGPSGLYEGFNRAGNPTAPFAGECRSCWGAGCADCIEGLDETECRNCEGTVEDPDNAVLCRKCIRELGTEAACACGHIFTPAETPNCPSCGVRFPNPSLLILGNPPQRRRFGDRELDTVTLYRIAAPGSNAHGAVGYWTGRTRRDPSSLDERVEIHSTSGSSAAGTDESWWAWPHALLIQAHYGKHPSRWPRGTNPGTSRAEIVVWGKHAAHGPLWLKLDEYRSMAQMKRYEREGWKVVRLAKGLHPDASRPQNPGLDSYAAEPARQTFYNVRAELLPAIRAGARRCGGKVAVKGTGGGQATKTVTITFHGASWANSQDLRAAFRAGLEPLRIAPWGLNDETLLPSGPRIGNPALRGKALTRQIAGVRRAWEKFHGKRYPGKVIDLGAIPGTPSDVMALGEWVDCVLEDGSRWSGEKGDRLCYNPTDKSLWIVSTRGGVHGASRHDGKAVATVAYRTFGKSGKDHAVYEHRFHAPLPTVEFFRAEAVLLQGGAYTVTDWIRR